MSGLITDRTKSLEILRNYNGNNPYILKLKRDIIIKSDIKQLSDLNVEYIIKNHDFTPVQINKTVKVTDWYSEKLKNTWGCEFYPEKIIIKTLLGETNSYYHCLVKYRKSMEPIYVFLSKRGIIGNFMLEDFNEFQVDFDRYDKLSSTLRPDSERKIKDHQKTAVKFLLSRKKCILADDMGLRKIIGIIRRCR